MTKKKEHARELGSVTLDQTPPGYLRTQSDRGEGGAIGGGGGGGGKSRGWGRGP